MLNQTTTYKLTLFRTMIIADQVYIMLGNIDLVKLESMALRFITLLGTEIKSKDRQLFQAELTMRAENYSARAKEKAVNYVAKVLRKRCSNEMIIRRLTLLYICRALLVSVEGVLPIMADMMKGKYRVYATAINSWHHRVVELSKAVDREVRTIRIDSEITQAEKDRMETYTAEYAKRAVSDECLAKALKNII